MTTASDSTDELVLSGANGPDSMPEPIVIPEIKVPTGELKEILKKLWAEVDEHKFEWMASIHNSRKIFTLDNMIPVLLGTKEQCEQFIEENRWEAKRKGYELELSASRRRFDLNPAVNYPVVLRPINFSILPDAELATDDWGCSYIERSGDPEGLQIELSRG